MYKNNLKKYNFNIEEIKLFDSFAGIGALHKSLQKLGIPIKLVGMSEIDIDAIISYSAIYDLNKSNNLPSEDVMRKYLIDRNIGFDFKKGKSKIPRLKKDKLIKCYIGSKLTNNFGDISLINPNELPDFDLFNFSFPCTNISVAGKQEGMKKEDGSITSSGLYIYGINIIKEKKPKYIMIENVKNLISKKFIGDFNKIISQLEEIGYNCYYPTKEDKKGSQKPICLNAKNYGIPQNRERIFVICVRKDVDNCNFKFWEGKDFGIRLKDVLEDNVDEKYYLSQEIQDRFKLNGVKDKEHNELNVVGSSVPDFRSIGQRDMTYGTNDVMSTLTAIDYKQPKQVIDTNKLSRDGKTVCEFRNDEGIRYFKDNICGTIRTIDSGGDKRIIEENKVTQIANIVDTGNWDNPQRGRIYSIKGISPTLNCCGGGGLEPKIYQESPMPKLIGGIGEKDFGKQYRQGNRVYSSEKTAMCLMAQPIGNAGGYSYLYNIDYRIRKLTPLECWRLMGFDDEDFYKAQSQGISDSQLYKQAGNSIVVNCLYYIFKELFKDYIIYN